MRKRRSPRCFKPNSLGTSQLESLVLLDGTDWSIPALTGVVSVDKAAVDDSKAKLATDMQAFKTDLLLYKSDMTDWKLDRNDYNVRVLAFKLDARQFNDDYHPLKLTIKTSFEVNPATGQQEPKLVVEADLTGVVAALLPNANADLVTLRSTADALNKEKQGLDARKDTLIQQGEALFKRFQDLLSRSTALQGAENNVTQEGVDQQITVSFDNSNLPDLEDPSSTTDIAVQDQDAVDTFDEVDYFNDDGGM